MKKLFFGLFLFYSICGFAQRDSSKVQKIIYGVNLNGFLDNNVFGNGYSVDLTVKKGHCQFALGLLGGEKITINVNGVSFLNGKSFQIYGTEFGFRFYPSRKEKIFNIYFEFNNLIYNYSANEKEFDVLDTDNVKHIKRFDFENFISCGFTLRFLKRFSLNTSFGLGIFHEKTNYVYDNNNKYIEKFWATDSLLKFGISYQFKHKQ